MSLWKQLERNTVFVGTTPTMGDYVADVEFADGRWISPITKKLMGTNSVHRPIKHQNLNQKNELKLFNAQQLKLKWI